MSIHAPANRRSVPRSKAICAVAEPIIECSKRSSASREGKLYEARRSVAFRGGRMSSSEKTVAPRKLPGSLEGNRRLDRWLRINRNETVTVFPGKVEIGQGILTALTQIVAEELDVAFERIRLAPTDTSYSPDEGVTSGSRSIQEGGEALRHAAAEARELLLDRAAAKLGVSLEQLTVQDGVVTARSGGSVSYWQLTSDDLLAREASGDALPKSTTLH